MLMSFFCNIRFQDILCLEKKRMGNNIWFRHIHRVFFPPLFLPQLKRKSARVAALEKQLQEKSSAYSLAALKNTELENELQVHPNILPLLAWPYHSSAGDSDSDPLLVSNGRKRAAAFTITRLWWPKSRKSSSRLWISVNSLTLTSLPSNSIG